MKEELPTYVDINPFGHRDLDGHDAARKFLGVDKQTAYKMFDDNLFFYSEDLGNMGEDAFRYYSGALYDYTTYLSQSSSCEADEFLSHCEDILSIFRLRKIYHENSNYANDPYKSICNICIQKLEKTQTHAREFILNSTLYLYAEEDINKMILEFKSIPQAKTPMNWYTKNKQHWRYLLNIPQRFDVPELNLGEIDVYSLNQEPLARSAKGMLTIYAGYSWDGYTGIGRSIETDGTVKASLLHDFLYQFAEQQHDQEAFTQCQADKAYRRYHPLWARLPCYIGVRLAGWRYFGGNEHSLIIKYRTPK